MATFFFFFWTWSIGNLIGLYIKISIRPFNFHDCKLNNIAQSTRTIHPFVSSIHPVCIPTSVLRSFWATVTGPVLYSVLHCQCWQLISMIIRCTTFSLWNISLKHKNEKVNKRSLPCCLIGHRCNIVDNRCSSCAEHFISIQHFLHCYGTFHDLNIIRATISLVSSLQW